MIPSNDLFNLPLHTFSEPKDNDSDMNTDSSINNTYVWGYRFQEQIEVPHVARDHN